MIEIWWLSLIIKNSMKLNHSTLFIESLGEIDPGPVPSYRVKPSCNPPPTRKKVYREKKRANGG